MVAGSLSTPWLAELGLVVEELTPSLVSGHVELGAKHHTPWGVVHGGVYATIVETVGSLGASAAVEGKGQFAVGVNNSTDFLRPMTEGRLDVVGRPLQQGRVQQLWDVTMTRPSDGKVIAQGRLRLQNVALPA
jgi:1,4-dihydroxy-2-naphthoyl-CoA hydrolase